MAGKVGDLTKSGLLWEGNYTEWQAKLNPILNVKGYGRRKTPRKMRPGVVDVRCINRASIMLSLVAPTLLARIPEASREDSYMLEKLLPRFAAPFRLMDLPAELIDRVIEMTLEDHKKNVDVTIYEEVEPPDNFDITGLCQPALWLVSKPLHARAHQLYFSCRNITLHPLIDQDVASIEEHIMQVTEPFASKIGPAGVRALRNVTLEFGKMSSRRCYYTSRAVFTFDMAKGLEVNFPEFSEDASEETKSIMTQHVVNVERVRKVLDLRGESIILAIIGRGREATWDLAPAPWLD